MDRRRFLVASAGTAAALALGPRALASRSGGTWLVLATADLEGHVALLDGWKLRPIARVRTAPGPRSIESAHDRFAVVGHSEHGVVTLVDADTRDVYGGDRDRVLAELDRFEAPRYTAVHPRVLLAYVTDSAAEEVVTIDLRRARIVDRTRVPGPARHVSISPDGRTLWTALGNAAARIAVLDASDPRRPRLVRTFAPPFAAHDVVFAPDGQHVWVTSGDERRLASSGRTAARADSLAPARRPSTWRSGPVRRSSRAATTERCAGTGSTGRSSASGGSHSAPTTSRFGGAWA